MILILSSFVASSPVGGGAQVVALREMEIEAALAPTVLLGRHPGLGPPGGGPVDPALFEGVLTGIEANGGFARAEAVITGYFASPEQVAVAARTLDAVRRVRSDALIVVDPIMGDEGKGLYVPAAVADAIARDLAPRADLIAPNAWELAYLSGGPVTDAASAIAAARALGRTVLVSSIDAGPGKIAVLWVDETEAWLATHARAGSAPNGTGDLLTALFTAALISGASPPDALETAVSDVAAKALGRDIPVSLQALG